MLRETTKTSFHTTNNRTSAAQRGFFGTRILSRIVPGPCEDHISDPEGPSDAKPHLIFAKLLPESLRQ